MKFIIAIIIFSLIIIIHELGHFSLAKKNGICVEEFCLGLGPTLCSFQKGETKYSLKLFPFGGACMMKGEDEADDEEGSFASKSVWARMAVVFAGPLFNFLLAFILAVIMISCIGYDEPIISGTIEGSSAEAAGMQDGDKIVKINNKSIHVYREVSLYTYLHPNAVNSDITVVYERDGEKHTVTLTPTYDEESGRYLLGFYGSYGRTKGNVIQIVGYSAYEVKYWISTTIESLRMLVTGQVSANQISGPVGIVNSIGQTYSASVSDGWFWVMVNMLNISILLTANLGVMNLLPIPALDGGRLVFLIVEAIRGKRIDPDKEGMVHFIGFMILIGLMVLVLFNDVRNIL